MSPEFQSVRHSSSRRQSKNCTLPEGRAKAKTEGDPPSATLTTCVYRTVSAIRAAAGAFRLSTAPPLFRSRAVPAAPQERKWGPDSGPRTVHFGAQAAQEKQATWVNAVFTTQTGDRVGSQVCQPDSKRAWRNPSGNLGNRRKSTWMSSQVVDRKL